MRLEFDPIKSARNERERGLPFAAAIHLFDRARIEWEDRRKDYGEVRISTLGEIEGAIYFVSFTRRGETVRIISFRRANGRETRRYRKHVGEGSAGGED